MDTVLYWYPSPLVDIKFYDKNFGIASGYFAETYVTTNGGKYWKQIIIDSIPYNDGNAHFINNIQIPTPNTAYVTHDWIEIFKFTRDPTSEVRENLINENAFKIYPNPASNNLHFPYDQTQFHIRIYSYSGNLVLDESYNETIDVSKLPLGLYFIECGSKVGKFVVAR